jgi:polysaccharide export outer membrane protein
MAAVTLMSLGFAAAQQGSTQGANPEKPSREASRSATESGGAEKGRPEAGPTFGENNRQDPSGATDKQKAYRIGVGDVLSINVWKEPEVSGQSVIVRPDCKITLPLVKETAVLGLTTSELESVLTNALGQFIRNPDVTVIINEIRSMKLFIVGGVSKPGSYPLLSTTTVLHAIADAGGLTEFAKKGKIVVLRASGARESFDYRAAVKGEGNDANLSVEPGDTIIVPQ